MKLYSFIRPAEKEIIPSEKLNHSFRSNTPPEGKRMAEIKNEYYHDFLEGFLLKQINRQDIQLVLDNIQHEYNRQARAMIIIAWASGARPNEYLRLTPEMFSKSKEYLEIKMPGSKGSAARVVSLPTIDAEGHTDTLTNEVYNYVRGLAPGQYLFWFFRSKSKRYGVTKRYKRKDGTIVEKSYDKTYDTLSNKLGYYFPRWFEVLFPDGVPPYYLRHNRATTLLETSGREATIMNQGWKTEVTLKRYTHKTPQMRKRIAGGLMK